MIIDKWVNRWVEKRQDKKNEKTKIKNWARLYETLNNIKPDCRGCDSFGNCFMKYGVKYKNWPRINKEGKKLWVGCQKFKPEPVRVYSGVGVRGTTGYQGTFGISGISSLSGSGTTMPPWKRGAKACNQTCATCGYFDASSKTCTSP